MSKIEENQSDKSTMIDFEGKKLLLKIQVEKGKVYIYLTSKDFKNLKGSLSLENAKSQIHAFEDFTIQEVSNAMNGLQPEKHSLKEESGKYEFTIKLKVLRKEKPLKIYLEEFQKSKNEIIRELKELKISNIFKILNLKKKQSELEKECQKLQEKKNDLDKKIERKKEAALKEISAQNEKPIPIPSINLSSEESTPTPPPPTNILPISPPPPPSVYVPASSQSYNSYYNSNNSTKTNKFYKGDEIYKDFSIEEAKKNVKKIKNFKSSYINSICVLADKSLVTCTDNGIQIYDPYTYKFRLEVGANNYKYNDLLGLSTGKLLFSKKNKFIVILNIKGKTTKTLQTLNMGNCPHAIELTDKRLAIRGLDYKIVIYEKKYDDTYTLKDEIYKEGYSMYAMAQIDENSIAVSCWCEEDCVLFFNLNTKEAYRKVLNVHHSFNGFKLNDEYLIFYESNYIYLVDIEMAYCVDFYKTAESKSGGKNPIYACARLTSNTILFGDDNCNFVKLKITNNEFKEVESVRSPHEEKGKKKAINEMFVMGDGHVATAGYDSCLLVW